MPATKITLSNFLSKHFYQRREMTWSFSPIKNFWRGEEFSLYANLASHAIFDQNVCINKSTLGILFMRYKRLLGWSQCHICLDLRPSQERGNWCPCRSILPQRENESVWDDVMQSCICNNTSHVALYAQVLLTLVRLLAWPLTELHLSQILQAKSEDINL